MKLKAYLSFLFLILALGACSSDSAVPTEESAEEVADELDY
jgi:PBP1b-binding outer membrane lipoprotein LpoB